MDKTSTFFPEPGRRMDKAAREKEIVAVQVERRRLDAYGMLKAALISATNLLSDSADVLKDEGITSKTTPLFQDSAAWYRNEIELADRLWSGDIR